MTYLVLFLVGFFALGALSRPRSHYHYQDEVDPAAAADDYYCDSDCNDN